MEQDDLRDSLSEDMLGYYKQFRSPAIIGGKNKIQEDRAHLAIRNEEAKIQKEKEAKNRAAFLKKKLESYQLEKKVKEAQKHEIDKETIEKKKKEEQRKAEKKKQYYDLL
jgi:hypothetical protein